MPSRRACRVNPWIVARWTAFVAYFVVFVWFMGRTGIPFDRERLLLWIVGGLVVVSIGRPWRTLPRMFLDWSIFIIGITLYDFARGAARFVDAPIQVTPQAELDKIFGLGQIPTVWLQEHFLHAKAHWWDAAASVIYATHFILPFVVAGILVGQGPGRVALVREPLPRAVLSRLHDLRAHPDCTPLVREPDR